MVPVDDDLDVVLEDLLAVCIVALELWLVGFELEVEVVEVELLDVWLEDFAVDIVKVADFELVELTVDGDEVGDDEPARLVVEEGCTADPVEAAPC